MKKLKFSLILIPILLLVSCNDENAAALRWKFGEVKYNAEKIMINEKEVDYPQLFTAANQSVVSISAPIPATQSRKIGTGFIYRKVVAEEQTTYYIVTNDHVISEATVNLVSVRFFDYQQYYVSSIATNAYVDLAVLTLKIDNSSYQQAKLGNSLTLDVGESVFTIGNPMSDSFDSSFSQGKINGIDREVGRSAYNMIQTDCTVNPGNSGGALFDLAGQVVGVVRLKYTSSATEVVEGMAFAIPLSDSLRIIESLISEESSHLAVIPLLRINSLLNTTKFLSLADRDTYNITSPTGVFYKNSTVNYIPPRGVIQKINGVTVNSIAELNRQLLNGARDDKPYLGYYDGEKVKALIYDCSDKITSEHELLVVGK